MKYSYSRKGTTNAVNMGPGVVGLFGSVFLVVGIIVFVGGFLVKNQTDKFMKTAKCTTAVISNITTSRDSDGDTTHSTYVTYAVDGVNYTDVPLGFYSSSMDIGDSIDVYYQESNPRKITTKSGSKVMVYVMWGMGGIFAFVGGGICISAIAAFVKSKRNNDAGKMLDSSGVIVWGEVLNVVPARLPGGTMGYSAECLLVDEKTGQQYTARSEAVASDITSIVGCMVEVHVDSLNNEYNILLDSVQPKVNYHN